MILFSALYNGGYPFDGEGSPFSSTQTVTSPNELHEDGALVLWGGEDISPSLYGETPKHTYATSDPSKRDQVEWFLLNRAHALGIPVIGICRGAQLMCAYSKGKLVQHVNNHTGGNHSVVTKDGKTYQTSSVHHQMMYPFDIEHDLIAWTQNRATVFEGEKGPIIMPNGIEPEVVFFPQIRGLAIQGHPEFMSTNQPFVGFSNLLVSRLVKGEL